MVNKMNYCSEKEEIIIEGRLVLLLRELRSSVTMNRTVIGEIQNSICKISPLDIQPDACCIYLEPNSMLDELSILIDELNYSNKILERNLDNLKSIV